MSSSTSALSEQDKALSLLAKHGVTFSDTHEFKADVIRRMANQPRSEFDEAKLASLEASARLIGQLQDGFVRPLTNVEIANLPKGSSVRYEIVDGERRSIVCSRLGKTFRARIVSGLTPDLQYTLSVALNFNRVEHNIPETVNVCARLKKHHTVAEIAEIIGRSEPGVYQLLSLLELHPEIFAYLGPPHKKEDQLRMSAGLVLIRLTQEAQMEIWPKLKGEPTQRRAQALVAQKTSEDERALRPGKKLGKMDARDAKRSIKALGSRAAAIVDRCTPEVLQSISEVERGKLFDSVATIVDDLQMLQKELDSQGKFAATAG
jgi:ParB/RepB/Spo0J family partition protein